MTSEIPVTAGDTIIFDAPYTEADDYDNTHLVYEMFAETVGN